MEWDIWKKTLKLKRQEPSVPTCLTKISFGGIPNSHNVLLSFIPPIDLWGFCFWFCIRSLLPSSSFLPSLTLTQSLTHSHSHSSLTLTHSLTHSLTHHFPSLSLTQSLNHSHSHSSLTLTGVPLVPLGLRRFCVAGVAQRAGKGSDVRPGVPLASLWRPSGVPLVPFGLRRFCVAGVDQRALARGRMYALASLWRPSGAIWSPPLLRGRRGTTCSGKGTDPSGVPLVPSGLRRFCVAGVDQGRMYALAPTLTCGFFVFGSVMFCIGSLLPSSSFLPSLSHSLNHSLTHTLTHHSLSLIHSLIHLLITHSTTHSLTLSLITHSHSFTHSLTNSSLTHTHITG